MRILVSNDDGVEALGLRALAESLLELGEVVVCAPDREQSATSHSLTLHHPLRVRNVSEAVQCVDGTPTDCVLLALGELLGEKPDFVLSGINHGPNLGDDVLYSGTVAAAMESTILGIPSIAISYTGTEPTALTGWRDLILALLRKLLVREDFPNDTLLNINLPPVAPDKVAGVKVTSLGRRAYEGSLTRAKDPNGREYFWIGGGASRWWGGPDIDFRAIEAGYIAITPLHLDLTNYKLLERIGSWDLSL